MSPFDPAWAEEAGRQGGAHCDAVMAGTLLAVDPAGLGGIAVRAWSGAARDGFVRDVIGLFPEGTASRKLPLGVTDDRLLGGLDLAATLQAGRPMMAAGILNEAAAGVLTAAMAERIDAGVAARLAAAMDAGAGFAVLALDEGGPDEAPPRALLERLAFTVHEAGLPSGADWPDRRRILAARHGFRAIRADRAALEQICAIAAMLGIESLRAPLFALRAARAAAALEGRDEVSEADIALAARLVLAPRATRMPEPAADEPADEAPAEAPEDGPEGEKPVEDSVAEAAKAVLPAELLAALTAAGPRRVARGAGTSGQIASAKRGRPAGARAGALKGGARLALLDTLRAAAPWQRLRRRGASGAKIAVRKEDFRIRRFKEQPRQIAIFAVDASGSSAINRLAEAKGAIQLLLAECYVRRDEVALIAFRRREAEMLLAPTHALARAKRALAALPGGGPTPLAAGIEAARRLAEAETRAGKAPLLVLLTDGGANIGRDGAPGRAAAAADALAAGRLCRAGRFAGLVVDTAPRPQPFVQKLAAEMGANYLPLPYADAARLTEAVRAQGGKRAGVL